MTHRLNYAAIAPEAVKAMMGVERYLAANLDHKLLHLVKLRASQLNGCAYCIDIHWKHARASGEEEQRLYGLNAWQEAPYYSERERAALAWTEALTLVSTTHAPDEKYDAVREYFTDKELADLTWSIAAINTWNRVAIAFRAIPGAEKANAPSKPCGAVLSRSPQKS